MWPHSPQPRPPEATTSRKKVLARNASASRVAAATALSSVVRTRIIEAECNLAEVCSCRQAHSWIAPITRSASCSVIVGPIGKLSTCWCKVSVIGSAPTGRFKWA